MGHTVVYSVSLLPSSGSPHPNPSQVDNRPWSLASQRGASGTTFTNGDVSTIVEGRAGNSVVEFHGLLMRSAGEGYVKYCFKNGIAYRWRKSGLDKILTLEV